VIHQVLRQAGCIRINATDDVQVTKVRITLTNEQEQTLEQGEAVLDKDSWWEYPTAAPRDTHIIVEVSDLPGNQTRYEE
jgi:uncharacterized radical SAM superfamily Fe-S cluster-containing enzyme